MLSLAIFDPPTLNMSSDGSNGIQIRSVPVYGIPVTAIS